MGIEDIKRQHVNVEKMKILGAEIKEVISGTKKCFPYLKEMLSNIKHLQMIGMVGGIL
jgi:tryptophan synthase beta subunit